MSPELIKYWSDITNQMLLMTERDATPQEFLAFWEAADDQLLLDGLFYFGAHVLAIESLDPEELPDTVIDMSYLNLVCSCVAHVYARVFDKAKELKSAGADLEGREVGAADAADPGEPAGGLAGLSGGGGSADHGAATAHPAGGAAVD